MFELHRAEGNGRRGPPEGGRGRGEVTPWGCELYLVKLQFSPKTMQTAAEVCKLPKVDFWGVSIMEVTL